MQRRMLTKDEEASAQSEDLEVRREDQEKINKFSSLHQKEEILEEELRAKIKEKEDLEEISGELELVDEEEKVPYKVGDCFVSLPQPQVLELLSSSTENIDGEVEALKAKLEGIQEEMGELKFHSSFHLFHFPIKPFLLFIPTLNKLTMSPQLSDHLEPWCTLAGKVVMVTGASAGLGRDFCLDLARAGCRVVLAARRVDRLRSLCDEINAMAPPAALADGGGSLRAVAVELDIAADGPVVDSYVQKAWDAFGHVDALINNAGIRGTVKSPLELSEEEWNHSFRTNLTGTWLVSKSVCKRMRDAQRKGSIINIASIAGLNRGQLPGSAAYSSSKAGVNILTKVMALELGAHKIRVNSISPGLFKSEITEKLMEKDWLNKVAMKTVPLRRYGTADPALTSLARYLIHDSSEYVTGNNFIVDAGATLPGLPIYSSL